ncbi:MAG TPA: P1 family peptidase [Thermoplasmata archaeon]|nr:P1 family peptidase [Thermoplasmata archaeon]
MPTPARTLTLVPGVRVGQVETPDGTSGVSVVLFDTPAATVVDVRGGASATYDTASLSLDATFGRRWALFFAGGSLYGLDAARGVRTRILETGGGSGVFRNPNPIAQISGAALFDLPSEAGPIPDYLPLGYEAARRADRAPVRSGRFGAGAGATVGKYRGRKWGMRGGVGSVGSRDASTGALGALVAVNAVGAVRDPASGRWVAGARGPRGGIVPPDSGRLHPLRSTSTTLAIVVTEADVDRPTLGRVAAMVHTGLASAIRPFHSSTDGDVVFAAATARRARPRERRPGELADRLGMRAAELAVESVLAAARTSNRRR